MHVMSCILVQILAFCLGTWNSPLQHMPDVTTSLPPAYIPHTQSSSVIFRQSNYTSYNRIVKCSTVLHNS